MNKTLKIYPIENLNREIFLIDVNIKTKDALKLKNYIRKMFIIDDNKYIILCDTYDNPIFLIYNDTCFDIDIANIYSNLKTYEYYTKYCTNPSKYKRKIKLKEIFDGTN